MGTKGAPPRPDARASGWPIQRRVQPLPDRLPAAARRPHGLRRLRGAHLRRRRPAGLGLTPTDAAAVLDPVVGDRTAPTRSTCRSTTRGASPPARPATSRASRASSSRASHPPASAAGASTPPTRGRPATQLAADDPGAEMVVEGPVVSPQKPEDCPARTVADRGPAAVGSARHRRAGHDHAQPRRSTWQAHAGRPPPIVGPPLYGGTTPSSRGSSRGRPGQPEWFRELNLDPRNRIVGGLGTRVVQIDQEDLMASAWNQVDRRRGGQPCAAAGAAGQAGRRLAARAAPRDGSTTRRAVGHRARAREGARRPGRTGSGRRSTSQQPAAVGHHRGVPPGAPAARPWSAASSRPKPLGRHPDRARDRLTTDWVRAYANPDTIDRLGPRIKSGSSAGRRPSGRPGGPATPCCAAGPTSWPSPAPCERLTPTAIEQAAPHDGRAAESLVPRCGQRSPAMPTIDEMRRGPRMRPPRRGRARCCCARWCAPARHVGVGAVERPGCDVARGSTCRSPTQAPTTPLVVAAIDGSERLAERMIELVRRDDSAAVPRTRANVRAADQERLRGGSRLSGDRVIRRLSRRDRRAAPSPTTQFADDDRDRVDVPALGLVDKLDPHVTVPARVHGRLTRAPGGTRRGCGRTGSTTCGSSR